MSNGALRLRAAVTVITLAAVAEAHGQVLFREVGASRGIGSYLPGRGMGSGVSAADYDDDGDIDLFVPTGRGQPNLMYRNRGDGRFEEVAAELGLRGDLTQNSRIGVWFDYDADGRLDLAVLHDLFAVATQEVTSVRLYRQNLSGRFDEVTRSADLYGPLGDGDPRKHAGGMMAGDVDNDGWLDLYVAYWRGEAHLLINNRDGTFHNVTSSSGLGGFAFHWQPMIDDFNDDGLNDIFSSEDFGPNLLWLNRGDLTFVDYAAEAGVDSSYNEMGLTVGDYDNDGRYDFYITNVWELTPGAHSVLFQNVTTDPSAPRYREIAVPAGVSDGGWGWGTTFLDADNDGWLDLAATNGFRRGQWVRDQSRLFINTHDGRFADRSVDLGFDDRYWGMGLIAVDTNRDGCLDLIQTTNRPGAQIRLLECEAKAPELQNHWLVVRPRMIGPNTRAIGATVRVVTDELRMMRPITSSTSFMSQEPAEAHFGLGQEREVRSVRIDWPNGAVTTLADIAADQILTVTFHTCTLNRSCGPELDSFELELATEELALRPQTRRPR